MIDRADANRMMGGHRRRGRRPLFDGPVQPVKVILPGPVYDRLDRAARQRNESVPDVIRRLLLPRVSDPADFRGR